MPTLDIFRQDPFTMVAMTEAVERNPFQPVGLGEMDLFDPDPIRTSGLIVEERKGQLYVIPFSQRGEEGTQRTTEKRKARFFEVPRIMTSDTIKSSELQNIRAFGTESELMQVQTEVARRLNGPTGLLSQIEYTKENHRLAAVQGKLLDADGTTLYNWFDEFQIAAPTEIPFDLAGANATAGDLRPFINQQVVRPMARAAQGAWTPSTTIEALCGDTFYDALISHAEVRQSYLNWSAAAELRESVGMAFGAFQFGGVNWHNYRGSDDNETIKIPDADVKFFPKNAPGVFRVAYSPGENFEWMNTPGKEVYVQPIPDRDRNSFWKMEVSSYPLHICTRPELLFSGRQGA